MTAWTAFASVRSRSAASSRAASRSASRSEIRCSSFAVSATASCCGSSPARSFDDFDGDGIAAASDAIAFVSMGNASFVHGALCKCDGLLGATAPLP
eukprot:2327033-Prymnesium_polylepis.1